MIFEKGKIDMREIIIAAEIYLLAIILGILVAAIIKIMLAVIRRVAPKKVILDVKNEGNEGK